MLRGLPRRRLAGGGLSVHLARHEGRFGWSTNNDRCSRKRTRRGNGQFVSARPTRGIHSLWTQSRERDATPEAHRRSARSERHRAYYHSRSGRRTRLAIAPYRKRTSERATIARQK